ncbi:MAG: putative T7SS-secreted protein [Actinomycetes bacterium]
MPATLAAGARAAELVPGSPDDLDRLVDRARTLAGGLGGAAARLRAVDAGEWVGPAGDAFRDVVDAEPERYETAAEAFAATAAAVAGYAAVLRDAQGEARRAITVYAEADTASRDRAEGLLAAARDLVREAGDRAARTVAAAWSAAPREPRWWEDAGHFVAEIGRGAWEATAGLAEFAWSVSQVRMLVDPQGWARDMHALAQGLTYGATHPVEFGKAVLDWETWQESPGRAIGHLVPDLLVTLATAGGGAAVRATRGVRALDTVADVGTTFRRLDRLTEPRERLSYLDRARRLLHGREPLLPEPNLPADSPAGIAAGIQGRGNYPGVDDWYPARLRAGDEIGAGTVADLPDLPLSGFAVPRSVVDEVGTDARELFEGVQVRPYEGSYRDELTVYRAGNDLDVAVGYALRNPDYGAGGLRQVYVRDMQRLVDDGVLDVAERRCLTNLTARVDAETVPAP